MRGAKATAGPRAAPKRKTGGASKAAPPAKPASPASNKPPVRAKACSPSPRLADRRRKFIEAAERLFLERGFAGASVNEVVRIAGGSLATLYAEFGTKEELFEAVLSRRGAAIFEEGVQEPAQVVDVAGELHALAARLHARILSADSLAIYRLAVSEAPRFPGLRKAVLKTGLHGFLVQLSEYFAHLAAAGHIGIDHPLLAAERFLTLVQGQQLFTACCGDAARISASQRKQHLADAMDAFFRLYPLAKAAPRKANQAASQAAGARV